VRDNCQRIATNEYKAVELHFVFDLVLLFIYFNGIITLPTIYLLFFDGPTIYLVKSYLNFSHYRDIPFLYSYLNHVMLSTLLWNFKLSTVLLSLRLILFMCWRLYKFILSIDWLLTLTFQTRSKIYVQSIIVLEILYLLYKYNI